MHSTKPWVMSLFSAFSFWGWKFLSDHLPYLEAGTRGVWMIYFLGKFTASYFIGMLVVPYQIFKMFREIYLIQKSANQVSSYT